MGMMKEFRDFAVRGNVVDMAVGVVIGGAFGKIISSLVENIIMPPIGMIMGGVDFSNRFINLAKTEKASCRKITLFHQEQLCSVDSGSHHRQ